MVTEMFQKYIFICNIYFSFVRILSFKENRFIFNQNILVFENIFKIFQHKKYIVNQQKKMCSMNYFYSMVFGSQIWSSICQCNSVKLLHVLYSEFDAFVFCLRGAKYTFTSNGFCIRLNHSTSSGQLNFLLATRKVTDYTTDHFSTMGCIILNPLTPESDLQLLQHLRWGLL